ncbi:Spermatogenesis-Associated Protein 6 [Manis pentadactyla]|nr:Spermatogenesis-Associated Protein 6 [Manis pentadactyla]
MQFIITWKQPFDSRADCPSYSCLSLLLGIIRVCVLTTKVRMGRFPLAAAVCTWRAEKPVMIHPNPPLPSQEILLKSSGRHISTFKQNSFSTG